MWKRKDGIKMVSEYSETKKDVFFAETKKVND